MWSSRSGSFLGFLLSPFLAVFFVLFFHLPYLASVVLFFLLPSIWIAWRDVGILRKALLFAGIMALPCWLFIDALANADGAWFIPTSLFPWRPFGFLTWESFLFGFSWVLFSVLFYEHFLDHGKRRDPINPNIRFLVLLCLGLSLAVVVASALFGSVPIVPYFYLWCSLFLVLLPLLLFLFSFPSLAPKFLLVGLYFAIVMSCFEYVALHEGQWIFPGHHLLLLVPFFEYRIPIEEMVGWVLLGTPSLLAYYEFFVDDRR